MGFRKRLRQSVTRRLPQRFERSGLGSLGDRIRDYKGLGMGRRFPQMPMRQPTMQPMVPFPQEMATVVPRDLEQPAPVEQFGGTVVRRGPAEFQGPLDIGFGWERPFLPVAPMPMPSLTPEEITQQRIDQVSQFEQEPMMEPRYGAFGGSATNLPDYTTRTSRYPSVDWETIRPEGGHPLRFADAKFDPQRIGYADTGRRSDSGRPYALPGGYAGGGSVMPMANANGSNSRNEGFAIRMQKADEIIDSMIPPHVGAVMSEEERDLLKRFSPDRIIDKLPLIPDSIENLLQSDRFQNFERVTKDFMTPLLRRETGAVINESEIDWMMKTYIPMPGDNEKTIKDKSMARKQAIQMMIPPDTRQEPRGMRGGGIANLINYYRR